MSFTAVPNAPMLDKHLSLRAKGVYACITSYAGLPGYKISVSRLKKSCSDSAYAIRAALRELTSRGYLRHTVSISKAGAFSHAYDVYDTSRGSFECVSYVPDCSRPNGDLQFTRDTVAFTQVPNEVVRSDTVSLQVKALYTIMRHFLDIPDFVFRMGALYSVCAEKTKALQSAWQKLKLAGFLKQHRHPTGAHNAFSYSYELLPSPDMDRPYFCTCKANGAVSISSYIKDHLLSMAHRAIQQIRTASAKDTPTTKPDLDALIPKACEAIRSWRVIYVGGEKIYKRARTDVAMRITDKSINRFKQSFVLPDDINKPLPYVIASLYRWLAAVSMSPYSSQSDGEQLSSFDILSIIEPLKTRVARLKSEGIEPKAKDLAFIDAVLSANALDYEKRESAIRTAYSTWIQA